MKQLLYPLCAIILLYGCNTAQTKSGKPEASAPDIPQQTNDSVVPKSPPGVDGYDRRVLTLRPKDNESQLKLEITTGITAEVDGCNHYGLQGTLKQDLDPETGAFCHIFKSGGNVFHTDMGCPDDSIHTRFVSGPNILVDYNSAEPPIVYLPKKIELKLTVWKLSEMIKVSKNPEEELLKTFHLAYYRDNFDGYVIRLPELSPGSKVELIPGITRLVDCNHHWITTIGFGHGESVDFAWRYYSYESDGNISSTRIKCPNDHLTEKFIHSISPITLPVEKDVPIVFFIPKNFELHYRIWEIPDVSS